MGVKMSERPKISKTEAPVIGQEEMKKSSTFDANLVEVNLRRSLEKLKNNLQKIEDAQVVTQDSLKKEVSI